MRAFIGWGLLLCTAMTHASQDCSAESPCAVTVDQQTGKTTVRAAQGGVLSETAKDTLPNNQGRSFLYRQVPGREALSLEESAISYFEHVAAADRSLPDGGGKPFDPKNVLWDRGNLTDSQAAEVLEVARRLNPPGTPRGDDATLKASRRQLCQELSAANTPEAQVAALEASEVRAMARERAAGRRILDQLSGDTRESVLVVLDKHRDDITVNRTDWAQVRANNPEFLATQSKRACAHMN